MSGLFGKLADEWRTIRARVAIYACDGRPGEVRNPPWWQVYCNGRDVFQAARRTRVAIKRSANKEKAAEILPLDAPWALALMAVISMRKTLRRNANEVTTSHGEIIREALCLAVEASHDQFRAGDEFWVYIADDTTIAVRRYNAKHAIDETRILGRVDQTLAEPRPNR
ncbi:MAG: hypothetical protein FJX65_02970 [Alphaproteobacteria bacterium]|nr:hypothetical protein [Alphaproteobacteria bacterium]